MTMDDWLGSDRPLCCFEIRHESRMENADLTEVAFVCFSSRKPGGRVLIDGKSRECIQFSTCPELLVTLLNVEALEDNEALAVDNLVVASKIRDGELEAVCESDNGTGRIKLLDVRLIDASHYADSPSTSQYEEAAVLRELNKALIGFVGRRPPSLPGAGSRFASGSRRLSPIGESCVITPVDDTRRRDCESGGERSRGEKGAGGRRSRAELQRYVTAVEEWTEGRFAAGHSPTADRPLGYDQDEEEEEDRGGSRFESCRASPAVEGRRSSSAASTAFYSAADSLSDFQYSSEEDEGHARRYSGQLDTPEMRYSFAERLRAALRHANTPASCSAGGDSNYAVDISVAGSNIADPNIRMRRGGSRGFMLENDSSDSDVSGERIRRKWHHYQPNATFGESNALYDIFLGQNSSKYSFSTDCDSSDVADARDQLNRWLNESADGDDSDDYWLEQKLREDDAIGRFARSLLKRGLSESFVGVELTDVGDRGALALAPPDGASVAVHSAECDESLGCTTSPHFKNEAKLRSAMRSLSLELVRRNHRTEWKAEATGRDGQRRCRLQADDDEKNSASGSSSTTTSTIVTGNWGCGSRSLGDCQLKLLIQWAAASVAGVSRVVYYTSNHRKLLKLDTLRRILVDRGWNVGDVMRATIHYTRRQRTTAENVDKRWSETDDAKSWPTPQSQTNRYTGVHTDQDDEECGGGGDLTLFELLISSDRKIGFQL